MAEPLTYAFFDELNDANQVSLRSFRKYGKVRTALEAVNGRAAHVVDFVKEDDEIYLTYWIDAAHGGLPLKRQLYAPGGGLQSESIVEDIALVQDGQGQGIWIPTAVKTTAQLYGEPVRITYTVDPSSCRLNPALDQGSFAVRFGPGTTVNDTVAGLVFTTNDPESEAVDASWGPASAPEGDAEDSSNPTHAGSPSREVSPEGRGTSDPHRSANETKGPIATAAPSGRHTFRWNRMAPVGLLVILAIGVFYHKFRSTVRRQ